MPKCFQEGVLHRVASLHRIPQDPNQGPVDAPAVAVDEIFKRVAVAILDSGHSLGVWIIPKTVTRWTDLRGKKIRYFRRHQWNHTSRSKIRAGAEAELQRVQE